VFGVGEVFVTLGALFEGTFEPNAHFFFLEDIASCKCLKLANERIKSKIGLSPDIFVKLRDGVSSVSR
jgi:hypothetical protein